ncbi:MAG: sugar transferase [bacterium]|nr:sugar transferase [bacterium]
MIKRLLFHAAGFIALCLMVALAVAIYYKTSYVSLSYSLNQAYLFVMEKPFNFIVIAVGAYFLAYLSGLIKFTIEDKYFRWVAYLKEIFKLSMIVVMMAFVEFLVFYQDRIGRLIYLYFFLVYSIYYLVYMALRSQKGPRLLLWMTSVPPETVLKKYIKNTRAFRVIQTDQEREEAGLNPYVVYRDGDIDEDTSEDLIKSKLAGYTVIELVELIEKATGKIPLDYVNIHWFLEKFDVVDRNYYRTNRMFSIVLSVILLILLFLPGLLTALLHKLFSKGPVFFVQEREGLHGKTFKLFKFRTMVKNAESNGAQFTEKNDPRVTPIGKFMRRLRLDETPQLINVLKGDMSMVGPRPERKVFIDALSKEIPYYKLRLLVPPGLTGWAQINGAYAGNNTGEHKEKLEYDLFYIKNRGIFLDFLILLRTIPTILQARGE